MAKTPIPPSLRESLSKEPRMYRCVISDSECAGRIEWHHAVIYKGQSLQVDWAIHGICQAHHVIADRKDVRAKIVAVIHTLGGEFVKEYERIKKL